MILYILMNSVIDDDLISKYLHKIYWFWLLIIEELKKLLKNVSQNDSYKR